MLKVSIAHRKKRIFVSNGRKNDEYCISYRDSDGRHRTAADNCGALIEFTPAAAMEFVRYLIGRGAVDIYVHRCDALKEQTAAANRRG